MTMKSRPRLDYTAEARRELKQCRLFLRRYSPATVSRRIGDLMDGVRAILEFPEISRVRVTGPDTGQPVRRRNVGQFVIAYVYISPNESEPNGVVILRGFRHASMQDALWAVREQGASDSIEDEPTLLSTRPRQPFSGYQPLAIYGDISFTPDDLAPESQSPPDIRGHTPSPAE
jgi:plasmid stabilization system protein ParE